MKIGYLQQRIIDIAKDKGFITNLDVAQFYSQEELKRQMNKLVVLGYFEKAEDCITYIKWKFKVVKNDKEMS